MAGIKLIDWRHRECDVCWCWVGNSLDEAGTDAGRGPSFTLQHEGCD
jgi:hypothetical protein